MDKIWQLCVIALVCLVGMAALAVGEDCDDVLMFGDCDDQWFRLGAALIAEEKPAECKARRALADCINMAYRQCNPFLMFAIAEREAFFLHDAGCDLIEANKPTGRKQSRRRKRPRNRRPNLDDVLDLF